MPDSNSSASPHASREMKTAADGGRRRFILWLPAAVFAAVASTFAAAAFRFLRPRDAATSAQASAEAWTNVAPASELAGERPVMRKVSIERTTGWASRREERAVFILPTAGRVVSAVCPHEGCEVEWRDEARDFFCPCHDSRFAPDGERIEGPAQQGLAQLPSRVENGVLQIQYPSGASLLEERPQARG